MKLLFAVLFLVSTAYPQHGYVVAFKKSVKDVPGLAKGLEKKHGFKGKAHLSKVKAITTELTEAQAKKLRLESDVLSVQRLPDSLPRLLDWPLFPDLQQGGQYYTPEAIPAGIKRTRCDQHPLFAQPKPSWLRIALLDARWNKAKPTLSEWNIGRNIDFTGVPDSVHTDDTHVGHTCGTLAARINGRGLMGACPGAEVWLLGIFAGNSGSWDAPLAAMNYVAEHADSISIASNSWGGMGQLPIAQELIDSAVAHGVVYVFAAGNSNLDVAGWDGIYGTDDDYIPTSYPNVMSVSAMADFDGVPGGFGGCYTDGADDARANFTNYSSTIPPSVIYRSSGNKVAVAAPGVHVYSTVWFEDTYAALSGTSMATPLVSGIVGLYISSNGRAYNQTQVGQIIQAVIDQSEPSVYWNTNRRAACGLNQESLVSAVPFVPYQIDTCAPVHDTTFVTVHDTLTITYPVYVHDTTWVQLPCDVQAIIDQYCPKGRRK